MIEFQQAPAATDVTNLLELSELRRVEMKKEACLIAVRDYREQDAKKRGLKSRFKWLSVAFGTLGVGVFGLLKWMNWFEAPASAGEYVAEIAFSLLAIGGSLWTIYNLAMLRDSLIVEQEAREAQADLNKHVLMKEEGRA